MTALQDLPKVTVKTTLAATTEAPDGFVERALTLQNTSKAFAFMVHLRLTKSSDQDVVAFWSDNFVTLLPSESRRITLHYRPEDAPAGASHIIVDGWNVSPQTVNLR